MGLSQRSMRYYFGGFIGLGLIALISLYQNFSEVGFGRYEYTIIDLGDLGGEYRGVVPTAINSKGQIVGHAQSERGEWHAFLWTPNGGMKDLGTLGGGESHSTWIGDDGSVYGFSLNKEGERRKFKYAAGKMEDLGLADPDQLFMGPGIAAGRTPADDGASQQATVWLDGRPKSLGTPMSTAYFANADGTMAAGERVWARRKMRPTIWTGGGKKKYVAYDIFEFSKELESEGRALGFNNQGAVVGRAISNKNQFAFIWTPEGGLKNINTLMRETDTSAPGRSWHIRSATAINDCGQVTGEGVVLESGVARGYLLTPISPSSKCRP